MDKNIMIIGGGSALSAAIQSRLANDGVEVISPEQAEERGITISSSSMTDRLKEIILIKNETESHRVPFTPPLTRRERRAEERRNK